MLKNISVKKILVLKNISVKKILVLKNISVKKRVPAVLYRVIFRILVKNTTFGSFYQKS